MRFSKPAVLGVLLVCIGAACEQAPESNVEQSTNSACPEGFAQCGNGCVDLTANALNCGQCGLSCGAGQNCAAGICSCSGTTSLCGSACVDLTSNPLNCGQCGTACGAGQSCVAGACSCAGGLALCGASCVDVAQDATNCGACGVTCSTGSSCVGRACSCQAGRTDCSGMCVDLVSDGNNCGACGVVCPAGSFCSAGACASTCAAGTTACGSSCVDLQANPDHCGGCDVACAAGQECTAGTCGCTGAMTACGAGCVNLQTDPQNCGGCGVVCPAGQACNAGICSCSAGLTLCGSSCVDLTRDSANCGACGTACSGGSSCSASACGCPADQQLCGSVCTNVGTDVANCGRCGNACGSGASCQGGVCVADNPGTGGAPPGTGGAPATGGSGQGSSCPDVAFTVSSSLSTEISTVGIVNWSVNATAERAYIDFGRTAGSWEYQAPVDAPSQSGNRTLLLGMKPSTTYSYQVSIVRGGEICSSEVQTITTGAKRNGLPTMTLNTPNPGAVFEGFTIMCQFVQFGIGGAWTVIIDKDGDHVWWYQGSGGADCVRSLMSYDGQYMWMANGNVPGPNNGTLTRVAMDGTNETTYTLPNRHHDIAVLPDETIAYIEYDNGRAGGCDTVKSLNPTTQATDTIFQVAQANAGSNPDCHSNAINWWPDQNLFTLSVLNWDTIIAFDRQGSLQWIFGGSASTYSGASWDAEHQHHYLGDRMLIFNNNGTNGSSALEFQLNGNQAQQTMDYASGRTTNSMGDVKRLANGNTLVTYSNPGVIHEIDSSQQLVQEITTDSIGYTTRRRTLYGPPPPYQD